MPLKNRPAVVLCTVILGLGAIGIATEFYRKPAKPAVTNAITTDPGQGTMKMVLHVRFCDEPVPAGSKPDACQPRGHTALYMSQPSGSVQVLDQAGKAASGTSVSSVGNGVLATTAIEADTKVIGLPTVESVAAASIGDCVAKGEAAAAKAGKPAVTTCLDENFQHEAIIESNPAIDGKPGQSVFRQLVLPPATPSQDTPKVSSEPAPPVGMDYQVLQIAPQNGPFTMDASSGTDKDGFKIFNRPVRTPTIEACLQAAKQQAKTGAVDFDCSDATASPVVSGHMTRNGGTFQLDAPDPRIPQFWRGNQANAVVAAQDEWKQLLGKYSHRAGLARTPN